MASSGELRNRGRAGNSSRSMTTSNNTGEDDYQRKSGLAAQSLIKESPTNHQTVLKLHLPFIYTISPACLKKFLCQSKICKSWVAPQWVPRYLVLLGSYLYRYTDEYSLCPKGTPIFIEQMNVNIIPFSDDVEGFEYALRSIPFGCRGVFSVESFGKTQCYGVSTAEDALVWVNSIREAKQESITRSMGHSKVPVPHSWDYYDRLAKKYARSKESIKARMEAYDRREFEMAGMQETPSWSPGGVYT